MMPDERPKKSIRVILSIPLTPDLKADLERRAGRRPVSVYAREVLFPANDNVPQKPRTARHGGNTRQELAALLARLGASQKSSSLQELARLARLGALPITPENLADVRALVGGRTTGGSDELYYQLYDFIGAEPPQGIGDIRGHYYAYRPSLSAPPKILKTLVQIERRPSGAVGYIERMEYNTKQDGSRRQLLEGFVLSIGREVFVITRDTNTGFIQMTYLDLDLRDAQVRENTRIMRLNGRYNGITFNASQARIFSTGIVLEAAHDQACRNKNLWEDSILDVPGIGLHHPDDLPDAIISRLERNGYQRPKSKRASSRSAKPIK